jgi:hypothetical protein
MTLSLPTNRCTGHVILGAKGVDGQVQSVTNYSRDWSVVKFNLHLEPLADIETVRKTIKRVGEELLDDP